MGARGRSRYAGWTRLLLGGLALAGLGIAGARAGLMASLGMRQQTLSLTRGEARPAGLRIASAQRPEDQAAQQVLILLRGDEGDLARLPDIDTAPVEALLDAPAGSRWIALDDAASLRDAAAPLSARDPDLARRRLGTPVFEPITEAEPVLVEDNGTPPWASSDDRAIDLNDAGPRHADAAHGPWPMPRASGWTLPRVGRAFDLDDRHFDAWLGDHREPPAPFAAQAVPEPASLLLVASGTVGLGLAAWRRRKRA